MTLTNTQSAANGDKFGIKAEIAIIPGWAYFVAAFIFVCIPVVFFEFVWPREANPPVAPLQILISLLPGTILAFLVLMIGYVNRDAGRRGMGRALWTVIVIFVPNAIGFILYFLLRNPIRAQCPKCGTVVDPRGNYCPVCRYSFHPTCPQCQTAVRPGDTFCANCGGKLDSPARA